MAQGDIDSAQLDTSDKKKGHTQRQMHTHLYIDTRRTDIRTQWRMHIRNFVCDLHSSASQEGSEDFSILCMNAHCIVHYCCVNQISHVFSTFETLQLSISGLCMRWLKARVILTFSTRHLLLR